MLGGLVRQILKQYQGNPGKTCAVPRQVANTFAGVDKPGTDFACESGHQSGTTASMHVRSADPSTCRFTPDLQPKRRRRWLSQSWWRTWHLEYRWCMITWRSGHSGCGWHVPVFPLTVCACACACTSDTSFRTAASRLFHFALLQVNRYGCDSLSRVFTDGHYVQREALAFPDKKARHQQ